MKKFCILLLFVMVSSLFLTNCGGGAEPTTPPEPAEPVEPAATAEPAEPTEAPEEPEEPAEPSTVILGLQGDPERMISNIWPMATSVTILDLLYTSLVRANAAQEFVPEAAERVEFSADGRTLTFHLRKDLTFHDGEPLTARDVAFTYNMMGLPEYNGGHDAYVDWIEGVDEARAGETEGISGIKLIDDYTISFTTPEPFAPALNYANVGILPEHVLGDVPVDELDVHEFNYHPVGSGPYKVTLYEPDRQVVMEAFDDWFEGRPKVDRIIWRISSYEAMLNAWLREEIDAIPLSIDDIESVEGVDFGTTFEYKSSRPTYLGFNCKSAYFSDERTRQAISYAVDRQELVDVILSGRGDALSVLSPIDTWSYAHNIPVIEQDLDKAAALLDEAGWVLNDSTDIREKDGVPFDIELLYVTDREAFAADQAALIQTQIKKVGINVTLKALDSPSLWPLLLPRGEEGDPDGFSIILAGNTLSDSDPDWMQIYLGSWALPPNGINFLLFEDATVDEMLKTQAGMMDFEERKAFWHNELYPVLLEKSPQASLMAPLKYFAVNNRFHGFEPAGNSWGNDVINWTVD